MPLLLEDWALESGSGLVVELDVVDGFAPRVVRKVVADSFQM